MKAFRQCFATAVFAVFLSVVSVWAQSPNKQFGVGVSINGGRLSSASRIGGSSINLAYAINPGFHLGASLGINVEEVEDVSYNGFQFGVGAKFLLAGTKEFKPFISAGFGFFSTSIEKADMSGQILSASVGAEFFATPNMGLYGGITPVSVQFGDIDATSFGLTGVFMGMEWFF